MKKLIVCAVLILCMTASVFTWNGGGLPPTVHVEGDKVITNEPIIIEAKAQKYLDSILPATSYGTTGARVIIPEWGYTARVNKDDGQHSVYYRTDACLMASPEWNPYSIGVSIGDHLDDGFNHLMPSAIGDEMLLVYPDRTETYVLTEVICGYAAHEYGDDSDFFDMDGALIREKRMGSVIMVTCRDGDKIFEESARTFGVWIKK